MNLNFPIDKKQHARLNWSYLMSTARQYAAYKRIKQLQNEDHQRKAYGMMPIPARHPQVCGCGRVFNVKDGYGHDGVSCSLRPGYPIVKFEGKWMNTACVDQIKLDRFRVTCPFVRELRTKRHDRWVPVDWTSDPKVAQLWREVIALQENPLCDERVVERT